MGLGLVLSLCCACPCPGVSECSPTIGPIAETSAEVVAVVAVSPASDAGASVLKRAYGRRSSRVVARLERRIARHKGL